MAEIPTNPWTQRQRSRFEKPFKLLPHCHIAAGGIWAELGCGQGIFSAGLAHHLGPDGRVIGLDINRHSLHQIKSNIKGTAWASQILPLQGDLRDPLPLEGMEGLLLANVLHYFREKEKKAILRRLLHGIRPGGQLILVEYNSHRGNPAVPHPLPAQDWLRLMEEVDWQQGRIQATVPSSFLGEMAAIQAERKR